MKTYKFIAKIEPGPRGGAFVYFPYDVKQEFGVQGNIPVHATFDGIPYTGSLIKYGAPQHMLGLLKAIREQTGKGIGGTIEVELWRDDKPRTVEVPPNFQSLMLEAGVEEFFNSLSYTHRKEYVRWLTEAKTEATKQKRLAKSIEMLKQKIKTPG